MPLSAACMCYRAQGILSELKTEPCLTQKNMAPRLGEVPVHRPTVPDESIPLYSISRSVHVYP